MTWSDTPPSAPEGWWNVRKKDGTGEETLAFLYQGNWWVPLFGHGSYSVNDLQFGQRIPSNAKLAELQRKAEELDRIHAVWGLKNS